jgi:adhesin transport system membrane fusion protein
MTSAELTADLSLEVEDALPVEPARAAQILLYTLAALFVAAFLWAAFAKLDKVTRGQGRVVPSNQIQEVQYLEGGIVKQILVSAGQRVKAGQTLVKLDPTRMNAEFTQGRDGYNLLRARIVRLESLVDKTSLAFPSDLMAAAPGAVADERKLYDSRIAEFNAAIGVETSKVDEASAQLANAEQALALANEEMRIIRPLVEKGIEPQIELLRAQQRKVTAERDMQAAKSALARSQDEARQTEQAFYSSVGDELAKAKAEMANVAGDMPALQDKIDRTDLKSPIDGVVNRVLATTLGGVVQPGQTLVEIVPTDDTLLVEAEIKTSDIGFLSIGQRARVRITAFDSSVYGALDGKIEAISADAIENEKTGERHYLIKVRTDSDGLKTKRGDLKIFAGMAAEVDVLNGKRTVLAYIMKPIADVQNMALTEQ